ncbi:Hypothetical protein CpCap5W_2221 [Corynebacterium pseudotuberculosis]|nr:Hypothetical protein CpATCC19410_2262 [Corynebacterium pseudotuberculosis]ARX64361.1 Hypothetical protein Cp262_2251 [Corynebacterium pseudotuberculosis]ATB63097.1 Hypothetical protein BFF96_2236 [Corynebacterium pseudotuberculosis]AUY61594.1 Hypothetical protein BFG00_2213 [Corynebacterium pseudotuberculosis]AZN20992.1 hypothetical protein CpCap1W_2209 [Corynebacterium pseudotuberculosis]
MVAAVLLFSFGGVHERCVHFPVLGPVVSYQRDSVVTVPDVCESVEGMKDGST